MKMSAKRNVNLRVLPLLLCLIIFALFAPHAANASGGIAWSSEELDFMAAHLEIRLGVDPTFIPYEFFDTDGVYKGIAADYIALIEKATGLKLTVTKGLTWAQAYEKAVGRELDVLPCVAKTTEREKYFLFSQGYYTFQRVIFINENSRQIKSFEDLKGKRVAVQANSSHHSFLMDYPTISLALYTTVEDALAAVSDGSELAFVGNLSTSSYLIKNTASPTCDTLPSVHRSRNSSISPYEMTGRYWWVSSTKRSAASGRSSASPSAINGSPFRPIRIIRH
jgi:two-component system sensor histidine kinase/response regulator